MSTLRLLVRGAFLVCVVHAIAGCSHSSSGGGYPSGPYTFHFKTPVPDLSFNGLDANGAPKQINLHDYFEPDAPASRLLILRVGAGWCGTCDWHLRHTGELFALDIAPSLALVDLVVADDDNVPATTAFLPQYESRVDAPQPVAIDPTFQLRPAMMVDGPLPLIVVVDRRTMQIELVFSNPDPDQLQQRLYSTLDELNKTKHQTPVSTDGPDNFHRNEWDLMHDMTLPSAPPADPTNAKADDPNAAALGKVLYSDASLSPSGNVSCATCHDPTKAFADGRPQSVGVATGDRNAPSVLLSSYARWQFWDGRADSLWSQALGPFENPKEFGSSRLFVAHAIYDRYKATYEPIFGALPDLSDTTRFPPSGKPGDPIWTGMAAADQHDVSAVYANVGKSIAAYERTLRAQPNAFDRYSGGDPTALTDAQKNALHDYFLVGCQQCHYGPRLTDDAFHVIRFPTGRQDGAADVGRSGGIPSLMQNEFLGSGPFSDDPGAARSFAGLTADPSTVGAFKTPPLRGVADTAPYGHGGTLAGLLDVSMTYGTAGLAADDPRAAGVSEPWLAQFAANHAPDVVPFLQVLTAPTGP